MLDGFELLEVEGHVGGEDHFDQNAPQLPAGSNVELQEDIQLSI